MNTQELFFTVAKHLMTQGKPSLSPSECGEHVDCAYRGEDGLKCAIGCLIKDEFYKPEIELKTLSYTNVVEAVEASIGRTLTACEAVLLTEMQSCHDKIPPSHWRIWLTDMASAHGFPLPECLVNG